MSKFKPTRFNDDVNVTAEHPLKEFFLLLLSSLGFVFALYLLLGLMVEFVVPRISVETENWLWSKVALVDFAEEAPAPLAPQEDYIQTLLDNLPPATRPKGYNFTVHIVEDPHINAYAMPGGNIVITSRLLETVESENALLFVLGHELGHFAHRDHLRGLGRGFAALMIGVFLLGQDSGIVDALLGFSDLSYRAYDRQQEYKADLWGLKVLLAHYGHVGGARDFLETIVHNDKGPLAMPAILSTHPDTEKRIETIALLAAQNQYPIENVTPLSLPPLQTESAK